MTSSDPLTPWPLSLDLTLPRTNKNNKNLPVGRFLHVFILIRSWWIDWCFVVVILYCRESAGDCWLVGFRLVCMDVRRSRMHNLLTRFRSQERRGERKWTLPFASMLLQKSSTILLPIVINKLGHSDPQGFITQLKCRLYLLPTGQSAGRFKPCGPLYSLRTNSSLIARPQSIYCRWRVDCLLVLHSSNWEWPLTVHDFSAVALPNCEMVPPPSSVLGMQGHVRIQHGQDFRTRMKRVFAFVR